MGRDRRGAAGEGCVMMKGTLVRGAGLSVVHLMMTLVLIGYVFVMSMSRFETGSVPQGFESLIVNSAAFAAQILMNPGLLVYDNLPSELRTDLLEWTLTILNSGVWGFWLLFIWRQIKSRIGAA